MQSQSLGCRQRLEAHPNLLHQTGRMEADAIDFSLMQVQPMEVEQVCNQLQQMFRRSLHVVQIETLPLVDGQA